MIRRVLLLALMLVLPLQWSWSVAASACGHEVDGTHFAHHEHERCAADASAGDAAPDQQHPDCQECHGAGIAFVSTVSTLGTPLPSQSFAAEDRHAVPEPPLARRLRPPLGLVA